MGGSQSSFDKEEFAEALKSLQKVDAQGRAEFFSVFENMPDTDSVTELVSLQEVAALRNNSPNLLNALLQATQEYLLTTSAKFDPSKKQSLVRGTELVAALLLGLFNQDDTDGFITNAFFGSSGKCGDCRAKVQPDWKVCPYCEKRLVRFSAKETQTLAVRLGSTLVGLSFVQRFTLADKDLWTGRESYDYDRLLARDRIVTAVLCLLAEPLSGTLEDLASRRYNRWFDSILSASLANEFFQSVVTVSLMRIPPGWFSGLYAEDQRVILRKSCLNLVLVLLCGRILPEESYEPDYKPKETDRNLVVEFLSVVETEFAFEAIVDMLKSEDLFAYGCGLLWNFVQHHGDFCDFVVLAGNCEKIVVPLITFILKEKEELKNHGAINLAIFILLALSSRRSFGLSLNAQLSGAQIKALPKKVVAKETQPTIADVVFVSIELIVASGHLEALHETLLMIMCNLSPFCKTLTMTSSVAIMRLFVQFSTRVSLLRMPRSYEYLSLILDVISNILQYQYEGNRALTYATVSYRDRFARLFSILSDSKLTVEQFRGDRIAAQPFHTKEWFDNWRQMVPTKIIAKVLTELVPLLERIEASHSESVFECISQTTIVGVLPPAPPIVIRRTARSKETDVWIATYIWSVVYNGSKELGVLNPKLFGAEK